MAIFHRAEAASLAARPFQGTIGVCKGIACASTGCDPPPPPVEFSPLIDVWRLPSFE